MGFNTSGVLDTAAGGRNRSLGMRVTALVCAFVFAFGVAFPQGAWADVRRTDIVGTETVGDMGLSYDECPSIDAERAVLMDQYGNVYFQRSAEDSANIASLTKVMTAIVALDRAQEGTVVNVSSAAAAIGESSAGLKEGDSMDLTTALKAMLVPSGNDAAEAIGETVGAQILASNPGIADNALDAFVVAMNEKAQELGLTNTVYENPHGLDYDQYAGNLHSCALDQTKVAQCAMSYSTIRDIVSGGSTTITVSRGGDTADIQLSTTDSLLAMYEYAIGIKTGVTNLAGESFMGAADNGSLQLYAVVLDSSDEYQRFLDAQELFEWGYKHIVSLPLANTDQTYDMSGSGETVPVVGEVALGDRLDQTVKVTYADPNAAVQVFDLNGNVTEKFDYYQVTGKVTAGQVVGKATFYQHNQVVAEQDLVSCENVSAPSIFDDIHTWWTRVTSGITGAQTEADSHVYNVMPTINDNTTSAA